MDFATGTVFLDNESTFLKRKETSSSDVPKKRRRRRLANDLSLGPWKEFLLSNYKTFRNKVSCEFATPILDIFEAYYRRGFPEVDEDRAKQLLRIVFPESRTWKVQKVSYVNLQFLTLQDRCKRLIMTDKKKFLELLDKPNNIPFVLFQEMLEDALQEGVITFREVREHNGFLSIEFPSVVWPQTQTETSTLLQSESSLPSTRTSPFSPSKLWRNRSDPNTSMLETEAEKLLGEC